MFKFIELFVFMCDMLVLETVKSLFYQINTDKTHPNYAVT